MTEDEVREFRARLLRWYGGAKRDLPWRKTRDPYRILVSEVMLQQTRAETAAPYYERFLARFPDPQSLARSETDEILKLWQGLGYYRRARYLQKTARTILRVYDGEFPSDVQELQRLPGVGPYTAAAVASIAFHNPVAVVDGNVTRVLARLFALQAPVGSSALKRETRELADQLLDPENPGDFNQAMMELGATICTPRAPACDGCPVQPFCLATSQGEPERFPHPRAQTAVPLVHVAVGIVWRDGKLLLSKRFDDAMLGGMWEFPGGKIEPGETAAQCVERELREELGIQVDVLESLATVQHAYTHFRVALQAFRCRLVSGNPRAIGCAEVSWVAPEDLISYPLPAATLKILRSMGILPDPAAISQHQVG